ncbi:MAG TPA: TetR/AcrR family transcriptional regulator [Acidimicrobiales bacterium]|jgi:AcrR family transcriptional regulator|nr:TetR/AcrR family transcriptional regulator [Acidimicrobiales bacterium]
MASHWLVGDQAALAAERILDAAGRCFAGQGVPNTSIADIARDAGCSRPTIYRYFDDRHALRLAFVHREARRLGTAVAVEVARIADPAPRFVEACLLALAGVRSSPTLAAWFAGGGSVIATDMAGSSTVIEAMAGTLVGTPTDPDHRDRARWVVRIILSLLAMPGADPIEERRMLERFVVPVAVGPTRLPTV